MQLDCPELEPILSLLTFDKFKDYTLSSLKDISKSTNYRKKRKKKKNKSMVFSKLIQASKKMKITKTPIIKEIQGHNDSMNNSQTSNFSQKNNRKLKDRSKYLLREKQRKEFLMGSQLRIATN